eukprot:3707650-Rhodomonas_salina.2
MLLSQYCHARSTLATVVVVPRRRTGIDTFGTLVRGKQRAVLTRAGLVYQESDQVQEPAGALGPRVPAGRCGVLRRYRLPQSRRLISASAAQFHPPRVSLPD